MRRLLLLALLLTACRPAPTSSAPAAVQPEFDRGRQVFVFELCRAQVERDYPDYREVRMSGDAPVLLQNGDMRAQLSVQLPGEKRQLECDAGQGATLRER